MDASGITALVFALFWFGFGCLGYFLDRRSRRPKPIEQREPIAPIESTDMLPKDILKYAVKFTPEQIKKAILEAISPRRSNVEDYIMNAMTFGSNPSWVGSTSSVWTGPTTTFAAGDTYRISYTTTT